MSASMKMLGGIFGAFWLASMVACGSDPAADDAADRGGGTGSSSSGGSGSAAGGSSSGTAPSAPTLLGRWQVAGHDARGAYTGQVDLSESSFVRSVQYTGVTVEGDRELHWAWIGTANGDPAGTMTAQVELDDRGFVVQRGELVRTAEGAPVVLEVSIHLDGASAQATYADGTETWSERVDRPETPLVAIDRHVVDAHDPPSGATKQASFASFASFQALPEVQPYVDRPEFQAAVHGHFVDTTDLTFYREHPNALRVINKHVDAISLQETLSRANAFRKTLREKAQGFDQEIESEFLDPATGMLLDGAPAGEPKLPHFSAALWTGTYLASQIYRFEVTGEAQAKSNAEKALDGLLKLQEVTGDFTQFARAIHVRGETLTEGWLAGAGELSNLEWMPGGNNDMMKGLYVGYLLGNDTFCKSAGYESLCARLKSNVKHLANDVSSDRGNDELDSNWLVASTLAPLDALSYRGKAEAAWPASKVVVQNTPVMYEQGIADWSGLNLGFVSGVFHMTLAEHLDLGGDAADTYRASIEDGYGALSRQRLPLWDLLHGAYGQQSAAAVEDAVARLREMPFPKSVQTVDHRVSPAFCLSPYPSLPWKNDWTTTDRTQPLRTVPLFEEAHDIYRFRTYVDWRGAMTARPPAPEYLLAYWFGRKHALIAETD